MSEPKANQLMTPRQVAALLQVSDATLKKWRANGVGPKWVRLGKKSACHVRYLPASVRKFAGLA